MSQDPDEDRIRQKAHELWEAEGHPHGRDMDHWEQAREIIAIHDSQASTLLPRNTGAEEPAESLILSKSYGDVPSLTDQGEHALTDISREPEALSPTPVSGMTSNEIKTEAMAVKTAPKPAGMAGKKAPASEKAPALKVVPKTAAISDTTVSGTKPTPSKAR